MLRMYASFILCLLLPGPVLADARASLIGTGCEEAEAKEMEAGSVLLRRSNLFTQYAGQAFAIDANINLACEDGRVDFILVESPQDEAAEALATFDAMVLGLTATFGEPDRPASVIYDTEKGSEISISPYVQGTAYDLSKVSVSARWSKDSKQAFLSILGPSKHTTKLYSVMIKYQER